MLHLHPAVRRHVAAHRRWQPLTPVLAVEHTALLVTYRYILIAFVTQHNSFWHRTYKRKTKELYNKCEIELNIPKPDIGVSG